MATDTNNLTWRELLFSVGKLHALSMQIALHRKVIFMCGGVLSYYAILYAFALWYPGEGFSVEQALNVLVEVPGTVLAIYLTMDMIAGERDKNTLEILFSTAISHYATWSVRIVTICAVLFATLMAMSAISYFFFAEFPFIWGGLNAWFPAFFIGGPHIPLFGPVPQQQCSGHDRRGHFDRDFAFDLTGSRNRWQYVDQLGLRPLSQTL